MFSGCPCVRASVRASVQPSLTRLQENRWMDFHEIFTGDPSRGSNELIRFSPYLVNFQGNGGAKYGKICTFGPKSPILL